MSNSAPTSISIRSSLRKSIRRSPRKFNAWVGRRTGWALARFPQAGTLDRELQRIIHTFAIEQIIDVGAHMGGFAHRMRASGFKGHIVSYEPSPVSWFHLQAAAEKDPSWRVENIAIGSELGEMELHQFGTDGQFDSILPLGPHAAVYKPDLHVASRVKVSVRRLADIWPHDFDPKTTLLKTDTQGFDLQVINGVGDRLVALPAVLMEAAVQPIYVGSPLIRDAIERMAELGFELTGAFPLHRYGNGTRVIEFDCTFVNTERASH